MSDVQSELRFTGGNHTLMSVRDPEQSELGIAVVRGYVAVWDSPSQVLYEARVGKFIEICQKGMFAKTITERDQRALYNHDDNQLLGRRKNGTLKLEEDEIGLRFELHLPDTSLGRDLAELIRRGDVDACSFGFQVVQDRIDTSGSMPVRYLMEVRMSEMTLTPIPAYEGTAELLTIDVRSLVEAIETEERVSKSDSFSPNEGMKEAAQRALDWVEEYGRGGTNIGRGRATDIVAGRDMSYTTVKRMASYFARHEVDKKAEGFNSGEDGFPSNGRIAWDLWGGDAGKSWSQDIMSRVDASEEDRQAELDHVIELDKYFIETGKHDYTELD